MNISEAQIEQIVRSIVKDTYKSKQVQPTSITTHNNNLNGVFSNIEDAILAAEKTYKSLSKDYSMKDRQKYIDAMKDYVLRDKYNLAKMVVEETKLGNYESKIQKHELAARTPGTESLTQSVRTGDTGLSLIEMAPFGVIGATTPVTNPTETVISNSIAMIAGGNTVVYNVHPSSINSCMYVVDKLNTVIQECGGPANMITMVSNPSMETLNKLSSSPKINLLVGTGGPGLVRSLLKSGKKAIGAGAGNPPVIVDETAHIDRAARDIITGHSFDNNIVCILEKEVLVLDQVANNLITEMQKNDAFLLQQSDLDKLMNLVLLENTNKDYVGCSYRQTSYKLNKKWVGKDPYTYLDAIGVSYTKKPKCIIVETEFEHPFVQLELLMPILPIVRVSNFDEAVEMAVIAEHGNRHTAMIHSQNITNITKFAKAINTTIFVKNAPSVAGIGVDSEGVVSFSIAGPTGEGITTAKSFTRARHCVLVDGFRII
jgi:propionaldehyde dehydrogenase